MRRAANIIAALESRVEVTVLAAGDPSAGNATWAEASQKFLLRRHDRRALLADSIEALLRGRPVLLVRSTRVGFPDAFASILGALQPDLVILGRPLFGPYIDKVRAIGARLVIDADESMPKVARELARSSHAPVRQRLRAVLEARLILGRLERATYPRADQVWVSSDRERDAFMPFVGLDQLKVVPNVVDLPDRKPDPVPVQRVAFVGWYRYPPNEAAALELVRDVMPAVRAADGPRSLELIGPGPTRAMIDAAAAVPDVAIVGEVPEVRSRLRAAGVLVVPVRSGGGTRLKILEAIACGVPIVSTQLGIEGLDLVPETHVLVAETAGQFAAQIGRLASDPELVMRLTDHAFAKARQRYSTDVLRKAIDAALAPSEGSEKRMEGHIT